MNFEGILEKLSQSNFRNRFHLKEKDIKYIDEGELDKIEEHCIDFIHKNCT